MADNDGVRAPADAGLSSLGLLMQLAGSVLAAGTVVYMFTTLVEMRGNGAEMLVVFLILGLSGVRSIFHRQAGTELLYGRRTLGLSGEHQQEHLTGIRRYIIVAVLHTAIVCVLLWWKYEAPTKAVLGLSAGLLLWPVILAFIIGSRRFSRFNAEMPIPEDKGFEGAAILMAVLGAIGMCTSTVLLLVMFKAGRSLTQGPGVLLMLVLIMLVIRSFIHLQAGIAGLRETSVERSVELANRYASFGVITSFCAGGALLLLSMATALNVLVLALVGALVWVLMTWPLIVRRFFSDRQFADLLAGDAASNHRRAPDAGLSGLGWLLITSSVLTMTLVIPNLVTGSSEIGPSMFGRVIAVFGIDFDHSLWWTVGFALVQAWAGIGLVGMSPMHRVVAAVYAIGGGIVQVYLLWPVIHELWHDGDADSMSKAVVVGSLARVLALPVATLLLVSRRLAPTARARFRSPPAKP